MSRPLIVLLTLTAIAAACSEDPAPPPGSASSSSSSTSSSSSSSSGSSGVDYGTTSSSSGGVDLGGTAIEATLSKPTDGYTGSLEPFKGVAGKGATQVKEMSVSFESVGDTSKLKRSVTIALGGVTPEAGKSYSIGTTGDDLFLGNKILYEEKDIATNLGPSANCGGKVTFDSITNKVYKFSFEGICGVFSGGKGGFSITGTGSGTGQ